MTIAQQIEQKAEKRTEQRVKLEVAEHLMSEGIELSVVEKTTGIEIKKLIALQKKLKGSSHYAWG